MTGMNDQTYPADMEIRKSFDDMINGVEVDDPISQAVKAEEERILKEIKHPISYEDQLTIAYRMLGELEELRLSLKESDSVLYAAHQILNEVESERHKDIMASKVSIDERVKALNALFRRDMNSTPTPKDECIFSP